MPSFLSSLLRVDRQRLTSRNLQPKTSKLFAELSLGEIGHVTSNSTDNFVVGQPLLLPDASRSSTFKRLKQGNKVEKNSVLRRNCLAILATKSIVASFCCVTAIFSIYQEKAFALPACNSVYASGYNGSTGAFNKNIYTLSGPTATLFSGTAASAQNFAAIAQGIDTNLYFDNGSALNIYSYSGSATSLLTGGTWQSWSASSGPGGGWNGKIYYVGADYHLYEVSTTGAVANLGALVPRTGDTIYSTLQFGDVASDANGRIYWYASANGSGTSYLYRIDKNTLKATNLGATGPTAASGLAFNSSGQLITTTVPSTTTSTYTINPGTLASSNLGTVTGLPSSQVVYDLASCNMPTLDPSIGIAKSVANITTSQNPATTANPGNTLEYTIAITNSGNLASDSTTLSDAIPTGTTYVAGSTKLNGTTVLDKYLSKINYMFTAKFYEDIFHSSN
jgi:uncharacterized repeat protein (TIGR01451 family)